MPGPGQRTSVAFPGSSRALGTEAQNNAFGMDVAYGFCEVGRWPGLVEGALEDACWPLPTWTPALGAEVAGATTPCTPYLE